MKQQQRAEHHAYTFQNEATKETIEARCSERTARDIERVLTEHRKTRLGCWLLTAVIAGKQRDGS